MSMFIEMSETANNENIIWTSEMPDRRKSERRSIHDFQANSRALNVTEYGKTIERRHNNGRRKTDQVTLTITGRAIDIEN